MKRSAWLFCAAALISAPATAAALAEPAPAMTGAVDGLVSSPENFRLVLENDQVRILEYTLLPGQKDRRHTHPQRASHVIAGGTLRVGFPDGTSRVFEERAGDSDWSGPSPLHDTENIGATPIRILLVEVKRSDGPSEARRSSQ